MKLKVTDLIILVTFSVLFLTVVGKCSPEDIDMGIIAQIESSNNPDAFNKRTQAVGLYQITKICLKDYNSHHYDPRQQYSLKEMFHPDKSFVVANWYMNKRIPRMLKFYKLEDSIENRLLAYNAGIRWARDQAFPLESKKYIQKYEELRG